MNDSISYCFFVYCAQTLQSMFYVCGEVILDQTNSNVSIARLGILFTKLCCARITQRLHVASAYRLLQQFLPKVPPKE